MILREAFDYPFSRLDPSGAHIDPPSVAIYETLMVKGPDWKAHPMLAQSWRTSEDGLRWFVTLRPDARFHSGARCDAAAIVAAFDFLRWNLSEEGQLWYWDPVDEVRAESDDEISITLKQPHLNLPSLLWGTHTAVFNEAMRNQQTERFGFQIADGTGPFRLKHWSAERVVAEYWPEHPGAGAEFLAQEAGRHLDGIEWLAILDEADRLDALLRGDVDCLHGPPLNAVDDLKKDDRFTVIEYPQASNAYLALNWQAEGFGFDDLRMRQALSLAIDREALVRDALVGHGTASYGPVSPGDEFYDSSVDANGRHDPQQAARLLDELGWRMETDGIRAKNSQRLEFPCVCQDDAVHRRVAEGVRGQLAALGVGLNLQFEKPFADFYDAVGRGPASFISKWLWQDPIDALIGFCATRGQPFPNWQFASVPALDEAFADWLHATTREAMRNAAFAVQRITAEQLPYIPLLTPNDVWMHGQRVHNWRPYPANLYPFYHHTWLEA